MSEAISGAPFSPAYRFAHADHEHAPLVVPALSRDPLLLLAVLSRRKIKATGAVSVPLGSRDGDEIYVFILATDFCPSVSNSFAPPLKRAQERPGARCTRGLVRKTACKSAHEHTGSAEAVRPSLRNGFYSLFRALPGDRAFLPPSPARCEDHRQLDASVGASGPHDFAVRISVARLATPTRPPQPAPTFVTMANVPSFEAGCHR